MGGSLWNNKDHSFHVETEQLLQLYSMLSVDVVSGTGVQNALLHASDRVENFFLFV